MPTDAERLRALALRHGIALAYRDIFGAEREAPEATLRALLAAMGIDADRGEPRGKATASAAMPGMLPPAVVVRQREQPVRLPVTLPVSRVRETLRCRIVEEGGRAHTQAYSAAESVATAEVVIEGTSYRVCELTLAPTLPTGYHRVDLQTRFRSLAHTRVIVAPDTCCQPGLAAGDGRAWGAAVQLYTLRSERNWGIGDFTDLRLVVEQWAERGADVVGVNPLHALFIAEPERASPYSASSRFFLNPLYLDVESISDHAESDAAREKVRAPPFQMRLAALRSADRIDYAGVAAAKREIFETLYAHFRDRHLRRRTARGRNFLAYVAARGEPLRRFALFEALHEHHVAHAPCTGDWRLWPAPYRDPDSRETRRFAREHRARIEFHAYLQWQCEQQLDAVQERAIELGQAVGVYRDLAVSVEASGADAWGEQSLYAPSATVGAPPDDFNLRGQNWGLAPPLPAALIEAGYEPWIQVLRQNMRGAGALRIDHVMALWRLFWIPQGATPEHGAYVGYPHDALLGILALESVRNRCMVIGEDLGTVPDAVRMAMRQLGILSYRLMMFEKDADGEYLAPAAYPPEALAAFSSHDLATLAGWWEGRDLALRAELELYPDAAKRDAEVVARAADRAALLRALGREGLLPQGAAENAAALPTMTPELARAVQTYIARAPARLTLIQLEDVIGEREQVNVPSANPERYPSWRRKLALPLEHWPQSDAFTALAKAMAGERRSARSRGRRAARGALAIPRATYRLQLNADFGFRAAAEIVPYLARLGISHCYSSPFLKARPGSTHGYDIVDHNAFNPELGTDEDFQRFVAALLAHGMGLVIDVVPNHMGVMGADNAWWLDVLENGPASIYAPYFDVDWEPAKSELRGKLLLPLLGAAYGTVLERGELALQFDPAAGEFSIGYFGHRLPIAPREYPRLLRGCSESLARRLGRESDACAELSSLVTAFANLPPRTVRSPEKILERNRDRRLCKRRLARLCAEAPAVAELIAEAVREVNGTPGEPRSFDPLHELLEAQPYRLSDWRAAADEINYRRFFDIDDLAAVRVEDSNVFDATHPLVLGLLQTGRVQGLRIDHPDGLWDPAAYFVRLQQRAARVGGAGALPVAPPDAAVAPAVYMVVEKILAAGERLPAHWPVHGTTGYDFLNLANGVLIDGAARRNLLRFHAAFVGERQDFDDMVYRCKQLVLRYALASELTTLANQLNRISESDRHTRDFTLNRLRDAIAEVIARFPVYRTYVAAEGPSPTDRAHFESALARACAGAHAQEVGVFDFLRRVLLLDPELGQEKAHREVLLRFVMRFQQLCGPVMAKGVEDTALYRYSPLVSLCEVGGDPRRFGVSVAEFHAATAERLQGWPHAMLATSTHDSKRSEDVRARIDVLTELQAEWRARVHRWTRIASEYRREVDGRRAPSASDEYMLYQTLIGAWPDDPADDEVRRAFAERVSAYMVKVAREAKLHTSWINPSPAYEAALAAFVAALLGPSAGNAFLADFIPFQRVVARLGMYNSLSQVLLKLACPGVPDFYQGSELWSLALVDPDNRRPVDYRHRARLLADLAQRFGRKGAVAADEARALLETLPDGRAKLFLISRALAARRDDDLLFSDGDYVPLEVRGERAAQLCAFARSGAGRSAVVLAPRLYATLTAAGKEIPLGTSAWGDTRILLAPLTATSEWRQVFTGERVPVQQSDQGPTLLVGDALRSFPVAMLLPTQGPA